MSIFSNMEEFGPLLTAIHRTVLSEMAYPEYLARHRLRLAAGLENTVRIYLDTKFWVKLREVVAGTPEGRYPELLDVLKRAVASRRVLCVTHFWSIMELIKQAPDKLEVTVDLVDQLSEGVAAAPPPELEYAEIFAYVAHLYGIDNCPVSPYQWTKVGLAHKTHIESVAAKVLPANTSPAVRNGTLKCSLDFIWHATLREVASEMTWLQGPERVVFIDEATVEACHDRKLARQQRVPKPTRDQVRHFEFEQTLRRPEYQARIHRALTSLKQIYGAEGWTLEMVTARAVADFRGGALGRYLPGLVIMIELYSLYEIGDPNKKATNNEWLDWQHAVTALPLCQGFFSENHLANQLTQQTQLAVQHGCAVARNADEALAVLKALGFT